MDITPYSVNSGNENLYFTFISEGPKGNIIKVVKYESLNDKVFNLGFGDKISDTDQIDDKIISNNSDTAKVLATVIYTIFKFFEKHPDKFLYITGSTGLRTRLYRRIITNNLTEIKQKFVIYGFKNGHYEDFTPNIDYDFFLIMQKI
jgi:hypothetical protein